MTFCIRTALEAPTCVSYWAFVLLLQTGKWLEMAAIRHEEALCCGVGAIARYLCYRFTISSNPPPNPRHSIDAWCAKTMITNYNSYSYFE
jgi:hypothetical protein